MPQRVEIKERKYLTYVYKISILSLQFGKTSGSCRSGQVREDRNQCSFINCVCQYCCLEENSGTRNPGLSKSRAFSCPVKMGLGFKAI